MPTKQWEAEHGKSYDVPAIIDRLVSKKILEDHSWHNDTAPSFMILDPKNEDYGLRIWVDHPLKSMRESSWNGRFALQEGVFSSESDFDFETDDLEELLLKLFERVSADRYEHTPIRKQDWFMVGDPEQTMKWFVEDFVSR